MPTLESHTKLSKNKYIESDILDKDVVVLRILSWRYIDDNEEFKTSMHFPKRNTKKILIKQKQEKNFNTDFALKHLCSLQ